MHIALSCTAEGFGHVARIVALAGELRTHSEITIFCPRRVQSFVREHLPDVAIHTIPYFAFAKKKERIDYLGTAWKNLDRTVRFVATVRGLSRTLVRLGVEGVVCDYDPYVAYAARRVGIPSLQVNHPGIVLRTHAFSLSAVAAKLWATFLMAHYDKRILSSFYDGDVGPIVRREIADRPRSRGSYFVVYLKPTYRRMVMRKLKKLGIENIEVFPDKRKDFTAALAGCAGVISSAGHQFMSEAMVLGKPVFVIPQRGQFEQKLNARMLERSGWGTYSGMRGLARALPAFMAEAHTYPRPSVHGPGRPVRFVIQNDLEQAAAKIARFFLGYVPTHDNVAGVAERAVQDVRGVEAAASRRRRRAAPTRGFSEAVSSAPPR
jgi:uncharacterized protein (TIGR00661 family)